MMVASLSTFKNPALALNLFGHWEIIPVWYEEPNSSLLSSKQRDRKDAELRMTCMTLYCCCLLSSSFFIVQAILRLFCVTEEKIPSVRCMVFCLGKCISGSKGRDARNVPFLVQFLSFSCSFGAIPSVKSWIRHCSIWIFETVDALYSDYCMVKPISY